MQLNKIMKNKVKNQRIGSNLCLIKIKNKFIKIIKYNKLNNKTKMKNQSKSK
jgi:hypothetical protein